MFDDLALAVGVLCGAAGWTIGSRLRTHDQAAPGAGAVAGFFIGFVAAITLIKLVVTLVAVAALGFVSYRLLLTLEPTVRRAVYNYSVRLARWRRPDYTVRGDQMSAEYERRRQWIRTLPTGRRHRSELLDTEATKYRDAIGKLSDQYPYLDGEQPRPDFSSWFDPNDQESTDEDRLP